MQAILLPRCKAQAGVRPALVLLNTATIIMVHITSLDPVRKLTKRLRVLLRELVNDPRSRLAGIRDPTLHHIWWMIGPCPIAGHVMSNRHFVFEYMGRYYLQAYDQYMHPEISRFDVGAPLDIRCGFAGTSQYSLRGRDVFEETTRLGRLPPEYITLHISNEIWVAIDAQCTLHKITCDDLLPSKGADV